VLSLVAKFVVSGVILLTEGALQGKQMLWVETGFVTQEKQLVPVYHKTNVLGLQKFLRDKLPTWANNGS
jgi:hypothetical protein